MLYLGSSSERPIILITGTVGPLPMSRQQPSLVDYASSDGESAALESEGPPKKKR